MISFCALSGLSPCSQPIGADGVWYYLTELAGSEKAKAWGPDPESHYHYDIICSGCANTPPLFTTRYFNKFYVNKVWTGSPANQFPTSAHLATQLSEGVYKYDIVVK
jgi:hypothetical protein